MHASGGTTHAMTPSLAPPLLALQPRHHHIKGVSWLQWGGHPTPLTSTLGSWAHVHRVYMPMTWHLTPTTCSARDTHTHGCALMPAIQRYPYHGHSPRMEGVMAKRPCHKHGLLEVQVGMLNPLKTHNKTLNPQLNRVGRPHLALKTSLYPRLKPKDEGRSQ